MTMTVRGPDNEVAWCASREKIGTVPDPLAHIWVPSRSRNARTLCGRLVALGSTTLLAAESNRCWACLRKQRADTRAHSA